MSLETGNARIELDDALSTFQHRLQRYLRQETTQNSVFSGLNDVIKPSVCF
jgi:hypothetical protein